MLNFDRIAAAQAVHTPFSYFSAAPVLDRESLAGIARDFPPLDGPGLFTLDGLRYGPFEGPRRAVMFNWMRSGAALGRNRLRHRLSAFVKRGFAVGY